jgi:signal transduction histidine kinase
MSIKRRIQLIFAAILLIVLGSALINAWGDRFVGRGIELMTTDAELLRTTFMLKVLMEEYITTGEERPLFQWQKLYKELGDSLRAKKSAGANRALLNQLNASYKEVGSLFSSLTKTEAAGGKESKGNSTEFRKLVKLMLSSHLQQMVSDAHDLHGRTAASTMAAHQSTVYVNAIFSAFMLVMITIGLYIMNRSIIQPVHRLAEGAEVIGNGNFDYRIEVDSKDELGNLARIFNNTAAKLRGFYDELQDEIRVRKGKEAELLRSNKDLEEFAFIASHDLQEPLRNVSSTMQLLEQRHKGKLGSDADQLIGYAVDSVKTMKILIDDLLAYSRVGARGKPFEKIDSDKALLTSLVNLDVTITARSAVITSDPLPEIYADSTQLTQVFYNLVLNGIKFNKSEPPKIHVSAHKDGNEWVYSVRDNGIGIDKRYVERVFLIFERLHKRSEYEGTGMGLAITRKIVERHGGRIWIESQPGSGSTVYFTIQNSKIRNESEVDSV